MYEAIVPPVGVEFHKSNSEIQITWKNGELSVLTGEQLRQFCACSECRNREVVGIHLINESTSVNQISLMGGNALQAAFDDGHNRGIYPWEYLYAIAQGRGLEFFDD